MVFDMKSRRESVFRPLSTTDGAKYWDHIGFCWDPVQHAVLVAQPNSLNLELVDLTKPDPDPPTILGGRYMRLKTYAPAWSPSGRELAFVKQGDIWIAHREDTSKRVRSGPIVTSDYYSEANRLAALAEFNDAEIGVSLATPFWVDEVAWTGDEKKLVFHYQRQQGSGVSEIGYLDLKPVERTVHGTLSGFKTTVHWLFSEVASPRICPDGKTLSYVKGWNDPAIFLSDWSGKHTRKVIANAANPDWRPLAK